MMELLGIVAGWVVVIFTGLIGLLVIVQIWRNRIDLKYLLAEDDGRASFSRFQFLIFTFVIAMCLLVLTLQGGQFPKISGDVLALLGISGGSYVVSKGIQLGTEAQKVVAGNPPPGTDTKVTTEVTTQPAGKNP